MNRNRNEILVKQGGTAEVKPFGPFDRSDQQGSGGFCYIQRREYGCGGSRASAPKSGKPDFNKMFLTRRNDMAKEKKMVEAITSMDEDFAQWYTDIVKKA